MSKVDEKRKCKRRSNTVTVLEGQKGDRKVGVGGRVLFVQDPGAVAAERRLFRGIDEIEFVKVDKLL